jgi:hypothetical protein
LSPPWQIALANHPGRDDSEALQVLDIVQVVGPADLHAVQDIVKINPQLCRDFFVEKEVLGKRRFSCAEIAYRLPGLESISSSEKIN